MEHKMVSFGEDYTKTQVISENNSIKYKLSIASGLKSSTPANPYFMLQDNPLGDQRDGPGVIIREFNPATNTIVGVIKNFELMPDPDSPSNQAFIYFLSSYTRASSNLLIITTGDRLYSSDNVADAMSKCGSILWPPTWLANKYPTSYVGIYSPSETKMISENVTYSDGNNYGDNRAALEFVYDSAADIGATGYIKRPVEDLETYIANTSIIKRYPNDNLTNKIADYGIIPGSDLQLSFRMYADEQMKLDNQTTRLSLRWFNKTGGYIGGTTVETQPQNYGVWLQEEKQVVCPMEADAFTIVCDKTDSAVGKDGFGGIEYMMLTEISRKTKIVAKPAQISVNGIRLNTIKSIGVGKLLILPDTVDDPSGDVYAEDFREFEKPY